MTYNPQWVDNSILDPTKFGNWVLVAEYNFSAESIDETITWNGEQDDYIRIEWEGDDNVLSLRPNNDTGNNYRELTIFQSGGSVSQGDSTQSSVRIGSGSGTNGLYILEGRLKNTGRERHFSIINSRYTSGVFIKAIHWTNTSSDVTSLKLFSGASSTGNLKVYKWQEVQPVELHSLELVAEYNFSAESIDETITWDGEQDDYIRIELNGDFDSLEMQINNDTGSNYAGYSIAQNGATPAAGGSISQTGITLTTSSGRDQFSILEGNLKNLGGRRCFHTTVAKYVSSDTDNIYSAVGGYWTNNSDDVTSITIIDGSSGAGSSTGNIKVYRRAKTSILSTAPDALHGLELSSVDASGSINVAPGSVEIKGKNIHLQSQKSVDVFTDLRSGDSVSGSQYVYAYAYDDNNTVNIEFSTTQPTKDRYGNTVTLDSNVNYSKGLYHANDPTRRYIGSVYVESGGSTIREFDVCYPGYCKGSWTPVAADADSGGNTSTTGTGKYIKTGSSVKVWGEIEDVNTTPLTGINQFNIQGLPYQSDGNAVGSIGLNGVNDPANDGFGITSEIRDTNSAIRIRITKDLGGDIVQVQDITDDNNLFIFQLDYITSEF